MITPFGLRDVALVRQLDGQGIPLDTEATLTLGVHLLRNAMASYLALGGRGRPTFVLRKGTNGSSVHALAQMRHRSGAERARILYIAPRPDAAEDLDGVTGVWMQLLDHLTRAAGARGAQSLVAEVPVESQAVELLRTAGFAVYTRQDVLRFAAPETGLAPAPAGAGLYESQHTRLRPREQEDAWNVSLLYANTAPRLLQLAEPPPATYDDGWRQGYVLEDKRRNDMLAYLEVKQGPLGTALKAWLHPDAEDRAGELITGALHLAHSEPSRPVYWCVSRYQGWLRGPLAENGFAEWLRQAVMVKHTVARASAEAEHELAALEKRHAKVVVPIVRVRRLPPGGSEGSARN